MNCFPYLYHHTSFIRPTLDSSQQQFGPITLVTTTKAGQAWKGPPGFSTTLVGLALSLLVNNNSSTSCTVCVYSHCWSTTIDTCLAKFVFMVIAGQQQELHILHRLCLQSLLVNNKSCMSCTVCVYSHCWSTTVATCLSLFVSTVTTALQQYQYISHLTQSCCCVTVAVHFAWLLVNVYSYYCLTTNQPYSLFFCLAQSLHMQWAKACLI